MFPQSTHSDEAEIREARRFGNVALIAVNGILSKEEVQNLIDDKAKKVVAGVKGAEKFLSLCIAASALGRKF